MKITHNKFKIKDLSGRGFKDITTKFLTLEDALDYFKLEIEDDLEDTDDEFEENFSMKNFLQTCYSRVSIGQIFNENPPYKIICIAYSHDTNESINQSTVKSFNEFLYKFN